ncbi:MAG TPA: choice-of-anchor Q domain-containing protein, partial [Blastocatellia bacterium]
MALAIVLLAVAGSWRAFHRVAAARDQQRNPFLAVTPRVTSPEKPPMQSKTRSHVPARAMATITVTNTSDGAAPGPVGSLRRAINDAMSGDTINFSLPNPSTITLTNGELLIGKALTISGPGATALTIDGNNSSRVFNLVFASQVSLSGLSITNGMIDFGGGIRCEASTLSVDGCAITGNKATSSSGGVLILRGSTTTITNSTISDNMSNGQSGGIQVENSTATLTNCTISGNTATLATGAVALQQPDPTTVTLINCTVANHSPHGVYTQGATIRLQNTLVASNVRNFVNSSGTITSLGNNLDSDGRSGFTNGVNGDIVGTVGNPINALLSPLNNHGGPTSTLALLPGSPAINAGTGTDAPSLDQRGVARVGATDIGAFESRGFALALASGNNQTAVVNTNFASPLSVTVAPNSASEPVNGGLVTFTPPGSGATATIAGNPATIASGAATTGTVTANGTGGTYNVAASANGAASAVNFSLTNNVAPTVLSIVRGNASPTSNGSVPFNVSFSESVTGVGNSNFTVAASGVVGASVASVLGSGSTRVVTVNTGTGSGSVGLNMTNSTGVTDSQGAAISNLTFTGETYTIDKTAPTTSLIASNVSTAGGTSYTFTVTYSDNTAINSASLDNSDVTVTGPGGPLAVTFAGVTPSGNGTPRTASYSITPPGGSWDNADGGTYTITMAANQVTDTVGNAVAAGTLGTFQVLICPSVFTVNDLGDTADTTPGDAICADSSGKCTLRAAVQEANPVVACSPLTINFSVTGTINLATALPNLNHPNLTITGPGANQLTVQRSTMMGTPDFSVFVVNSGKVVNLSGLTVTNGRASFTGGAVFNNGGNVTIDACEFSGNASTRDGGALTNQNGTLNVSNSTINNNVAATYGGGLLNIANGAATMTTLTNCTISGNSAPGGGTAGGIDTTAQTGAATVNLVNCTVTLNTGSGGGSFGGIGSFNSGASITLKNTIVAGNTGTQAGGNGAITSLGNNISSDGTGNLHAAGDQPNTNPLLAPLGNYGGTMPTHGLLPGSPAINAGTSAGAPATDQRGIARPQLSLFDIGAFESQGFTLTIASGNNQTTLVSTAFANPLSVTVAANGLNEPVNGGRVSFMPPGSGASAGVAGNPATISGGSATTGTVTANATGGTYNVAASATGATPINFTLTNNVAPTVLSIVRGNASPTSNGSVPFNVTFSESVTGVAAGNFTPVPGGSVTGAMVTNVLGSGSTRTVTVSTGLNSGTLGLNMTNSTGVTDSDGAAISNLPFTGEVYTIDKTAPTTTITGNPPNPSASANASFSFTGSDTGGSGLAGFECQLDGGGFTACTSPRNYTGLSDGSHNFQVRAIDAVGNTEQTPVSYLWLIDTTAPDTAITANPPNPSASANASFSFTGNDGSGSGVAGFECKLDSGSFTACASPQNYPGLSLGQHTFQVRAIDAAGNTDPTPASYIWSINSPPAISPTDLSRAAGSAMLTTTIATAGDVEDAKGQLVVQISTDGTNFFDSITTGNVTVTLVDQNEAATGINPAAAGEVIAAITTPCDAVVGPLNLFLRVTDSVALTDAKPWTLTITPNPSPVLTYAPATVTAGTTPTITPATGPGDNGTFTIGSVSVSPNNGGLGVLLNQSNGVVTILGAFQVGTYTVMVPITDNCGAANNAQLIVTVVCPTITLNP